MSADAELFVLRRWDALRAIHAEAVTRARAEHREAQAAALAAGARVRILEAEARKLDAGASVLAAALADAAPPAQVPGCAGEIERMEARAGAGGLP